MHLNIIMVQCLSNIPYFLMRLIDKHARRPHARAYAHTSH